jgi:hypothetical protein
VPWIAGLFLIAHGLVHAAIWLAPKSTNAPFDPHHSPHLGDARILATTLGVLAGLGFIVSGCSYLLGQPWWPYAALASAAISLVLLLLTFTPWWVLALAIDIGIGLIAFRAIKTDQ